MSADKGQRPRNYLSCCSSCWIFRYIKSNLIFFISLFITLYIYPFYHYLSIDTLALQAQEPVSVLFFFLLDFLYNSIRTEKLIFPLSQSILSLLPSPTYHSIYILINLSITRYSIAAEPGAAISLVGFFWPMPYQLQPLCYPQFSLHLSTPPPSLFLSYDPFPTLSSHSLSMCHSSLSLHLSTYLLTYPYIC